MKNITIGLVGTDWKVADSARYYAERGEGEEFAFGMTPSEALARLEHARLQPIQICTKSVQMKSLFSH